MTNEGDFPKVDGDLLFASEANRFYNVAGSPLATDIGAWSTVSASFAKVRSVTFSGPFDYPAPVSIGVVVNKAGATGEFTLTPSGGVGAFINVTPIKLVSDNEQFMLFPLVIMSGTTVALEAKTPDNTVILNEVYVWGGQFDITATIGS